MEFGLTKLYNILYYAILDILSNDFYVYIPSCCRHIG